MLRPSSWWDVRLILHTHTHTHTHTHAHMEPYPQHQAFVSRYVHGGAPYGSRHGYGGPTVPKLYKHQFTFRKPNGPVFTVTNKDRSAVLYIKKFSWFLSLSLSEIYDLAAGMNKIIERMEECRSVATGQAIHQPTCLADTETVLKMSPRRKQLDKEENAQLFYHQPMMMALRRSPSRLSSWLQPKATLGHLPLLTHAGEQDERAGHTRPSVRGIPSLSTQETQI